jgi:sugar (pentulose or hexulose) kinase
MEVPKILWLKKHMDPALFARCQFFDLPDFFTYKATGDNTRSFCSTTCKCSYVPDKGWQPDFFERIGLGELVDGGDWKQMGAARGQVQAAGSPVGHGLSKKAAEELGLVEGTAVGSGLIDAYVVFCRFPYYDDTDAIGVALGMLVGWVQSLLDTRRTVNSHMCFLLLTSLGTVWPLLLAQVPVI